VLETPITSFFPSIYLKQIHFVNGVFCVWSPDVRRQTPQQLLLLLAVLQRFFDPLTCAYSSMTLCEHGEGNQGEFTLLQLGRATNHKSFIIFTSCCVIIVCSGKTL
jgi:hypothetical protein